MDKIDIGPILKDFPGIPEQYELRRTIEFVANGVTYRCETWYCFTNSNAPWAARMYEQKPNGSWQRIEEGVWTDGRTEDSVIRFVMDHLSS